MFYNLKNEILLSIAKWCINHSEIRHDCLIAIVKKYPVNSILTAIKEVKGIDVERGE